MHGRMLISTLMACAALAVCAPPAPALARAAAGGRFVQTQLTNTEQAVLGVTAPTRTIRPRRPRRSSAVTKQLRAAGEPGNCQAAARPERAQRGGITIVAVSSPAPATPRRAAGGRMTRRCLAPAGRPARRGRRGLGGSRQW